MGGPERYLFNIKSGFEDNGDEVIPFSINYSQNEETEYKKYFVPPVGEENEIYFGSHKLNFKNVMLMMRRLFYDKEVERLIYDVCVNEKPDIAYVLMYLRKLSPAVLVGLKKANIPIVVRLSDYEMVCPKNSCFRHNTICTKCVNGNILNSVYHGCVRDSHLTSAIYALSRIYHRKKRYFDLIDAFITPSNQVKNMMIKGKFNANNIFKIASPVKIDKQSTKSSDEREIIYIGRIEYYKGVHILVDALKAIKDKILEHNVLIKIVGNGDTNYIKKLMNTINDEKLIERIMFTGFLKKQEINKILARSYISVVPSICYDNLPNSLLESLAFSIPVIGSDIGSIREVIEDGWNGYLFEPGNHIHLAEKLSKAIENEDVVSWMGENARMLVEQNYSMSEHIEKLNFIFESYISRNT